MEATTNLKAMPMAELLPGLSGILSKDPFQTFTERKQPRRTIAQTRTVEKIVKPLTLAEMRSIFSIKVQSPKRLPQGASTTKPKIWNSSVKVDSKTKSHTANGQMKHNPVKKMLNFQPKPKAASNMRTTIVAESTKFLKPEFGAKKSLALQARNTVRMSGISNIPETPLLNKPIKTHKTPANKENILKQSFSKNIRTPKPPINKMRTIPVIPDTPHLNESWKSSCDASFLQNEKVINDIEEKTKAIAEERTLERISEVTPPNSTPFKDYRNVKEYFNNSSGLDNSAIYNDISIMSFDKPTEKNSKREESVIVSLCDQLTKATMNKPEQKMSIELDDLLQIERQAEHDIKMIENSISALNSIKESRLKSLMYARKLLSEKKGQEIFDKTITDTKEEPKVVKIEIVTPEKSEIVGKPCSVIKSCLKSPSFRIPKKNLCLRKKVFCKSMPNVSSDMSTPIKSNMGNRALSVYMKMKEHMNFLNTPVGKPRHIEMSDSPAVTSHNLQKQLDKLYGEV